MFGPKGNSGVDSIVTSLSTHGVGHEVFSGSEANSRYPQQLKLPDDYSCVFEGGGGILRASKAVFALQVNSLYDCLCVWYSCFLRTCQALFSHACVGTKSHVTLHSTLDKIDQNEGRGPH